MVAIATEISRNFSSVTCSRNNYSYAQKTSKTLKHWKNIPFSVENKWRLPAMMTLYFGSGFAAPFFMLIVRHKLLKK
ncbi:hypothetical protein FD754_012013 [Muntiacus muntjak]|uniref:Cytochrome c oxidase subunit 7C, mitochondrial n=1 Tax=Muntiacus muntjak TaxID=9888 RepID=A0A5N3VG48_MUNMU|nr:hypothetical protein FD754_012013 [Muntiacus muntjak]